MSTTTTCSQCLGTGEDQDFGGACSACVTKISKPAPALTKVENDLGALADWLAEQTWSEFAQSLARQYRSKGELSPKQVAAAEKMKASCEAKRAAREASRPAPVAAEEKVTVAGLYRRTEDGAIYKVQASRSGNLYALRMVAGTKRGSWDYESGAIRTLKASELLDLESAKQYGRETGVCCSCGATLTDKASIEAGIGPICASKF